MQSEFDVKARVPLGLRLMMVLKPVMKKLFKLLMICAVALLIVIVVCNAIVVQTSEALIYTNLEDVPDKQVIIVLGASVHGDRLSMVLEDRTLAGMELYNEGKAPKLLLSGDHGDKYYDEVNAMRKYVLDNDARIVPEDIFMDHAGFDTYDSLYRAKAIFGVESAIIVTQDFHIDRAVYIAKSLGIDAVGYQVDESKYKWLLRARWYLREGLSRVKAVIDVSTGALPKYLGEPMPIVGDGRITWDKPN